MPFSENLSAKRVARGFSQQELADRVGSKKQNIAAYEQGRAEPSNELLMKIAAELKTTPGELLGTETTKVEKTEKFTYWESRTGHFTEQEKKDLDKFIRELLTEDQDKRKNAMDVARVVLKQGKKKKE
jgi:transcriptional regulator with XRE-family HTH domain